MHNEKFNMALSDVVWRFHAYEQYGKIPQKAIKAPARRAPGYERDFYKRAFELDLRLLISTIEAVKKAPKRFKPENIFSNPADVDSRYVMNKLRSAFPDQTDEYLKSHLGMVIYWYYLR